MADSLVVGLISGSVAAVITSGISIWQLRYSEAKQAERLERSLEVQKVSQCRAIRQREHEAELHERQSLRDSKASRLRQSYVKLLYADMAMRAFLDETKIRAEDESKDNWLGRLAAHSNREYAYAIDANAELSLETDAEPINELFWGARKEFYLYKLNLPFLYDDRFASESGETRAELGACEQRLRRKLDEMEVAIRAQLDDLQISIASAPM